MARTFQILLLAAGAGLASAALTTECTTALTNLAANSAAADCLDPSALITLFISSSNTSIIDPINNWLTGLCAAGSCSNDTLSAVVTNVTSGCSAELGSLGFSTDDTASIITAVQQFYPTAREIACLKTSDTLCVTQTLTDAQTDLGTISLDSIVAMVSNGTTIPSSVICTDCVQEAYNILSENFPTYASQLEPSVESECGSSFVDGTIPSDVTKSAASGSASSNAALSTSFFSLGAFTGVAVSAVVAISSGFVFLA